MAMIEFIKPTKGKIILFVLLLTLSFIPYTNSTAFGCSDNAIGLPFTFYSSGFSGVECPNPIPSYNWVGLALNLIFWYLVSSVILHIYNKIKK
ncbi:MAG TPA: hypothetical protein VJG83_00105 [archaeon]|nr:hypothetical protein [archaeon]